MEEAGGSSPFLFTHSCSPPRPIWIHWRTTGLCQSSIVGSVYSCPAWSTGVWSGAIDGEGRQVHSTEFIPCTASGAPQAPRHQLSRPPRTWVKQDNRRLAVQGFWCSLQEPSYCAQASSFGKHFNPALAFRSSQLPWYSEPWNSGRGKAACVRELSVPGEISKGYRSFRNMPFESIFQEKKRPLQSLHL